MARLLHLHPDFSRTHYRALQSSLGRALRKLQAEGRIMSAVYKPGDRAWSMHGSRGFWLPDSDRKATAYHEAGHAVLARKLGIRVKHATIIPGEGYAGRVAIKPAPVQRSADWKKDIIMRFSGPLAELEVYTNKAAPRGGSVPRESIAHGGSRDRKHIKRDGRALQMMTLDEGRLHDHSYAEFRAYFRNQRVKLKRAARALVRKHWPEIERVAKALIERETLSGAQIDRLMQQPKERGAPRPARRGPRALAGRAG